MVRKFYFYSDPARYEDQIALGRTPMLKIGETTQETTEQRVKQQDGTSCAQPLDVKHSAAVKDTSRDTNFHIRLEDRGYKRVRENREWFYITVEQAIAELEAWESGAATIKEYYTARPHQAWVNQEILKRWDGYQTIIQPLNLAPRFGKTLQALSLFKDSGLEVMVVAAHWLAANNSFVDTVKRCFDITAGVEVIKPDYDQFKAARDDGRRVLIDVSLHTDVEKIDPRLIGALNAYKKLIYIDEADFGAWTSSSRETAAQFIDSGVNLVCVATGTNIDRALIGSTGKVEVPIEVSYLDLVEEKLQNPSSNIVLPAVLNLDANNDFIDEQNDLTDEQRINMPKVFRKRNAHLQRSYILKVLFDEVFNADVFGMFNTEYAPIEHPAVMNFIPGTKESVNSLVKIGRALTGPRYNWIALHGDEHTNRSAQDYVLDVIKNGGGERTVIVSCGMGSRSFSVPNIIAVVDCNDGGTAGAAMQRASRCLTPGLGKTHGLVVNYTFNLERISGFESALISDACKKEPSYADGVRRVFGLVDYFKKSDNGDMLRYTEGDYLQFATDPNNLTNMASALIDFEGFLNNVELHEKLDKVNPKSKGNSGWSGPFKKPKTFIPNPKSGQDDKKKVDEEKKWKNDLKKKLNSVVDKTSNVYYMVPDCKIFRDCIDVISSDPYKTAAYTELVGVEPKVVQELYDYLPMSFMDTIVQREEKFGSKDKFSCSTAYHPPNMFDDVINQINEKDVLYLGKEPGDGVMTDIEKLSVKNNVTIVDAEGCYGDYYRKMGYNVISRVKYFELDGTMRFDVVIGNMPFQDSSNTDNAQNLWSHFWSKALDLSKDDGIVCYISPSTWCSPSRDFKSPKYGHKGDVRLWDSFNRYTSIADVDNISKHFKGVGSTFSKVTVYKSGNKGLSFTSGYDTTMGFLPKSHTDEVFSRLDTEENLGKYFTMDDQYRPGLKVSVPVTRGFINKPDMIQILQGNEVGTSASEEPRFYRYIYVDDMETAEKVKQVIMDNADILCDYCRWVGYLNLKMVDLIKWQ